MLDYLVLLKLTEDEVLRFHTHLVSQLELIEDTGEEINPGDEELFNKIKTVLDELPK